MAIFCTDKTLTGVRPPIATKVELDSVSATISKKIQVEVDFGAEENSIARLFVAAAWVTADSIIDCSPAALDTDDHDMDDIAVEMIGAYATKLQPGVGFNVLAVAPNQTWGRYLINCIGR